MLSAFEATMRQNSKDEAAWRRTQAALSVEPPEVKRERRRAAAAGLVVPAAPARMSVEDAEAMLARFAASDAQFGA